MSAPSIEDHGRIGQVIAGRYRVLRLIGAGGMGEVYEAENVRVGKRVALKLLSRALLSNPELVERFGREARAASAAVSPHVVEMLDVGRTEDDGTPFLVMELLEGEPLSRALSEGPLSFERVLRIGVEVARGLDAAHRAGVIHRDLKPDNVFLVKGPQGTELVKLVDFGISKVHIEDASKELTRTGSALGTPTHMAPEQVEAKEVDARTDVWALGVLLYQMITGALPFDADSYGLMLVRILQEPPTPIEEARSDVPPALVPVVLRCLAKVPSDRFASASEVASALSRAELGHRSTTPPRSVMAAPAPMPTRVARPLPASEPIKSEPIKLKSEPLEKERPLTPSSGIGARTPARSRNTPTALGNEFRAPRQDYTLDLESILATVPEGSSVKGLFLQSVVDRVHDRKALFAKAGVAERRIVPFLDFPYGDYMRVLVAAAETVFPNLPRTVALRRFHHSFYEAFSETLAGRVMFGVLGKDASRIMPIGARGWQVNVKLGAVSAETLGPKHMRYVFAGYPALICECCDVGVIEGAMRFFGENATVRVRTPSLDHTDVDVVW